MKKEIKCICLGMLDLPRIESARRVYDRGGESPTIMTHDNDIKVLVYEETDSSSATRVE